MPFPPGEKLETSRRQSMKAASSCCFHWRTAARVSIAIRLVAFAMGAACLAGAPVQAQEANYPSRPLRVIVPFPAGGPTDLYARVISQKMQEAWGQPVVVENRVGGTGLVGTQAVMQAAPDGYTLLFTSNSAHVVSPLLRNPPPFDSVKDFTPISMAIKYPMYLLINPQLPAKTLPEFIALAKAKPGQLNYSSVGIGSGGHLACELFNIAAGTNIVHVPYKGAAPAQAALVAGEAQMFCDSVGNSQQMVDAGKMRGLAVFADKRLAAAPNVPTMAENGLQGLAAYIWLGMLAPPNTPPAIANKLTAEAVRIMALPDVKERALKGGNDVVASNAAEFARDMRDEMGLWARVIRTKNIKPE
jgi:tripartite-type tricarboxylate transporter receptor subunit TctC